MSAEYSTAVIVKFLSLPFIALAVQKTNFAPNSSPPEEERAKFDMSEKTRDTIPGGIFWIPPCLAAVSYVFVACEVYTLLCEIFPQVIHTCLYSLAVPAGSSSGVRITASFTVGWILCCTGSAIRVLCYRHLGRHFTFQLSVRKEHKLITDGPYSWVRHPAYLGAFLHFTGLVICDFGPGSWWLECGLYKVIHGWLLLGVMVVLLSGLWIIVVPRMKKEDLVLKKEFGEQWVHWARKTPNMIFPYIY